MGGEAVSRERVLAWCGRLVEYANDQDLDSDCLVDFLVTGMLRIEPLERFSAALYLTKAGDLAALNKPSASLGVATPTRTTVLASAVRNKEQTPTVITGTLWNVERENRNYDDDDNQAGRPVSNNLSMTSTSYQLGVSGSQSSINILRPRKDSPKAIFGPLNNYI